VIADQRQAAVRPAGDHPMARRLGCWNDGHLSGLVLRHAPDYRWVATACKVAP
jgi:hypothetical protein